jgi:hypothetical protein
MRRWTKAHAAWGSIWKPPGPAEGRRKRPIDGQRRRPTRLAWLRCTRRGRRPLARARARSLGAGPVRAPRHARKASPPPALSRRRGAGTLGRHCPGLVDRGDDDAPPSPSSCHSAAVGDGPLGRARSSPPRARAAHPPPSPRATYRGPRLESARAAALRDDAAGAARRRGRSGEGQVLAFFSVFANVTPRKAPLFSAAPRCVRRGRFLRCRAGISRAPSRDTSCDTIPPAQLARTLREAPRPSAGRIEGRASSATAPAGGDGRVLAA